MAETARVIHPVGTPGEPAYQSGFQNEVTFAPLVFYRTSDDVVHIEGTAVPSGADIPGNSLIFTLPIGYRPIGRQIFIVAGDDNVNDWFGQLNIFDDGRVTLDHAVVAAGEVCIGVSFRAKTS